MYIKNLFFVSTKLLILVIVLLLSFLFISCSSDGSSDESSEDGGIVTSRIKNENSNHSISDYENAGLKKPKSGSYSSGILYFSGGSLFTLFLLSIFAVEVAPNLSSLYFLDVP